MTSLQDCRFLDAKDPLRALRDLFVVPEGVIYLDGNSLGAMPKSAPDRIARAVKDEWGQGLIGSWNGAGWYDMPRRLGDKIAALVGANPGELVATDTTSINLYKVLSAAITIAQANDPSRRVIVSERTNFPTDLYIAQALCRDRDCELRLVEDERVLPALGSDVAVLMLTHVNYRTGAMLDMHALTRAAHDVGALTIWDLCHSAGAVPVDLHAASADFAIGCGYKYLNGGPGAPAFVWVHPRHRDRFEQPLSGWWGHAAPFEFTHEYQPAPGIARFGFTPIYTSFEDVWNAVDHLAQVMAREQWRRPEFNMKHAVT
jgi:kynureninase